MQKIKNLVENSRISTFKILDKLDVVDIPKVNSFIVGTQKGGTSALYDYLKKSRQVVVGKKKEMGFFSREKVFKRGPLWYSHEFKNSSSAEIILDATPEYLYFPYVPERIAEYNPDGKIIMVLREPISRAFSHYTMFKNLSEDPTEKKVRLLKKLKYNFPATKGMYELLTRDRFPTFSEVIREEINSNSGFLEPSFVRRGCYYEQVKRYFDFFPKENILILDSKELMQNKKECVKKTADFLGITSDFISDKTFKKKHVGKYKEPLNHNDYKFLIKFYENWNQKLFELIGKKFDW